MGKRTMLYQRCLHRIISLIYFVKTAVLYLIEPLAPLRAASGKNEGKLHQHVHDLVVVHAAQRFP